jgi:hypothetical protein
MTEQDRRMAQESIERQRRIAGYSAADEVAKLAALRDSDHITAEEYDAAQRRAMVEV